MPPDALARRRANIAVADIDLLARIERLETRLAAIEAGRGPRDAPSPRDVAVVVELARASRGLLFQAVDACKLADFDPALAAAMAGALVDTPKQLGKLLARCAKAGSIDGFEVVRGRTAERGGLRWQVSHV